MEDLVIMKNKQAVTTSLQVAESFGKKHQHVMEAIRKLTVENSTVGNMFVKSTYFNQQNHEQPMYYMNRDGFTLLAMGFTGKEAMKFKLEYIEAFNKMEYLIKKQQLASPKFDIPKTLPEALRLAADQAEKLDAQKKLNAKQAKQLQDQEPDVIFSHTMLATNHSCKVRQLAADLTKMGFVIGQNQLYELLRLKGYISKHSCEPMGSKVKYGYFVVRHGVTNGKAWSQTLVTPKGQRNIINKCLHGKWDKEYQQVMTGTFSI